MFKVRVQHYSKANHVGCERKLALAMHTLRLHPRCSSGTATQAEYWYRADAEPQSRISDGFVTRKPEQRNPRIGIAASDKVSCDLISEQQRRLLFSQSAPDEKACGNDSPPGIDTDSVPVIMPFLCLPAAGQPVPQEKLCEYGSLPGRWVSRGEAPPAWRLLDQRCALRPLLADVSTPPPKGNYISELPTVRAVQLWHEGC